MYRCVIYEEFGVISLAVENRARNICNLLLKLPVVICMCRNGRFTVPGEPIKSIGDAEEDFGSPGQTSKLLLLHRAP
jgi:hypothetical protein